MIFNSVLHNKNQFMHQPLIRKRRIQDTEANLTNKIQQLETLNHIIAHNLRGSVANIKMLAEVLLKKNIPDDCSTENSDGIFTIGEAIQYISESSLSLLATLNTVMAATDIRLNDEIKFDDCDIEGISEHVINQMRGFMKQKKATIEYDLAVSHISYPVPYMESILYNFINNALKYCRPDVELKITVSTYIKDGETVLTVRDNGLGIDLHVYGRKIFNLYQVFHPGYESKGVGLYIIKTQIESLGGRVSVKSQVNEGSEFMVVFNSQQKA